MRRSVIIFAKAPILGQVKTRLIPVIGEHKATELYQYLLKRTIETVELIAGVDKYLYVSGESAYQYFEQFSNWTLVSQRGADIGERQQNALYECLADNSATILIGADIIDICAADIVRAFDALQQGFDAVIGPSADGGYWLIGSSSKPLPIFNDIRWSSARVFSQTRTLMRQHGLSFHCIAIRHDIDEVGDLRYLALKDLLCSEALE